MPNQDPEYLLFRWIGRTQGRDLATIFGDLSQSNKQIEIKLPLVETNDSNGFLSR